MAVPNSTSYHGIELTSFDKYSPVDDELEPSDNLPAVAHQKETVNTCESASNSGTKVPVPEEVTEFKKIVADKMMRALNKAPENCWLLKGQRQGISLDVCGFLDVFQTFELNNSESNTQELLKQLKIFNAAYQEQKAHLTVLGQYEVLSVFINDVENTDESARLRILCQKLESATSLIIGMEKSDYLVQQNAALDDFATRYLNKIKIPATPYNVQTLRELATRHLDSNDQKPKVQRNRSMMLEQIGVSEAQQEEFLNLVSPTITLDWVIATARTTPAGNLQFDFSKCNCPLSINGKNIYRDLTATYFCIEEQGIKRPLKFADLKNVDIWSLPPNDVINLMSSITGDNDTATAVEVVNAYYRQHKGHHRPSGVAFLMQIEKHFQNQGDVALKWISEVESDQDLDLLAKLYDDISDPKIKANIYFKLVREEKVLVAQPRVSSIGRFVNDVLNPRLPAEPQKYILKPNYLIVGELLCVAPEIFEGQAKAWLIPLFLQAAAAGDIQCLDLLHGQGVEPNCRGEDGKAAIHYACLMNQLKVVEWLMQKDKRVLEQTCFRQYQWRPLILAIQFNNERLFDLLVRSDQGTRLLSILAFNSSEGYQNIFHYLCQSGNEKYLKKVLESGKASLELLFKYDSNSARNTPVHLAIKHGHYEMISLLKEAAEKTPRRGSRPASINHLWHDLITDENCKSLRGYNFDSYIDTTGLTMAKKLQLKSLFTLPAPKKTKKQ